MRVKFQHFSDEKLQNSAKFSEIFRQFAKFLQINEKRSKFAKISANFPKRLN